MEILFFLIQSHGSSFTPDFWKSLCEQILMPFFEKVKPFFKDKTPTQENKLVNTGVFNYFVELISFYFNNLKGLFFNLLDSIEDLISNNNEVVFK